MRCWDNVSKIMSFLAENDREYTPIQLRLIIERLLLVGPRTSREYVTFMIRHGILEKTNGKFRISREVLKKLKEDVGDTGKD